MVYVNVPGSNFRRRSTRLVRAVVAGRITPAQPIAVHENYAAQHRPVFTRGLPWLFGKYGRRCAICSPVSEYRSLIFSLLTEPESDRASHINGS
jgi:hypothetical protein